MTLEFYITRKIFTVKQLLILIVLIDFFIIPWVVEHNLWIRFLYLLLYEGGLFLGLLYGLQGIDKYRNAWDDLMRLALKKEQNTDYIEGQIINSLHQHCLILGWYAEKRNKEYGLFKKKTKKNEVDIK